MIPPLRKKEKIMKRTIKQSMRYLLGAVLLLGVSCIRDEYPPVSGMPGDGSEVMVELRLQTLDGLFGATTRSAVYDYERQVDNALVLFFKGNDTNAVLYGVSEGRNLPDVTGSGTVTFQASVVVEAQYANQPFTCVVLANMQGRKLASAIGGQYNAVDVTALRSLIGHSTYADVQALLCESVTEAIMTGDEKLFPMYGRATAALIPSSAATQRLSVPLIRSVARVQIDQDEAVTNFELTEAYVFRATNGLALLPEEAAFESSSSTVVTTPSLPAGAAALDSADPWSYTISGNQSVGTIYLPEADTHLTEGATPGDANHTNRCAMVVGGRYNNSMVTSYYRIDFTTTATGERELLDVLRNHSYNITINAVRSAGESTPLEAYESLTANIDASIIEWTDENQEIVFDGTNWASVNRKRIEFSSGSDLLALLNVLSNMAPSSWTMSMAVMEGSPAEETVTAAVSSEATITGRYFSVTKPADLDESATSQGGDLEIRTLQANTTESTIYEEMLYITIGRLEIVVTLIQKPYEDIPWEDGGEFPGGL